MLLVIHCNVLINYCESKLHMMFFLNKLKKGLVYFQRHLLVWRGFFIISFLSLCVIDILFLNWLFAIINHISISHLLRPLKGCLKSNFYYDINCQDDTTLVIMWRGIFTFDNNISLIQFSLQYTLLYYS